LILIPVYEDELRVRVKGRCAPMAAFAHGLTKPARIVHINHRCPMRSAWPTARRPTILPNSMASAAPRSIVRACKSELAEGTGRLPTCLPLVPHDGPVACDLRGPFLPLSLPPVASVRRPMGARRTDRQLDPRKLSPFAALPSTEKRCTTRPEQVQQDPLASIVRPRRPYQHSPICQGRGALRTGNRTADISVLRWRKEEGCVDL
jgi:hypothetical protein